MIYDMSINIINRYDFDFQLIFYYQIIKMTAQQQNESVDFVPSLDFDDYEILNAYPFTIRRKGTHRVDS